MGIRKELQERFDYEIVDEFLDHFDMATDSIEPLTVELEKPECYERNIDELFRIFHNLKSATGFLHIELINKFAMQVESLLEVLRKRTGPASSEIVDWLLLCDDHLSIWNTNLRLDEPLTPLPESLQTLPTLEEL